MYTQEENILLFLVIFAFPFGPTGKPQSYFIAENSDNQIPCRSYDYTTFIENKIASG